MAGGAADGFGFGAVGAIDSRHVAPHAVVDRGGGRRADVELLWLGSGPSVVVVSAKPTVAWHADCGLSAVSSLMSASVSSAGSSLATVDGSAAERAVLASRVDTRVIGRRRGIIIMLGRSEQVAWPDGGAWQGPVFGRNGEGSIPAIRLVVKLHPITVQTNGGINRLVAKND